MIINAQGFTYAIENRLIQKLDIMCDRVTRTKQKLDSWLAIEGSEGCLAGDTIIQLSRGKNSRRYPIKKLYQWYNSLYFNKNKRKFDSSIPSLVRSYDGKEIRLHKIKNVLYSGKKMVCLLALNNGKTIKATATHKFLTRDGWKELSELKIGEEVMCDNLHAQKSNRKRIKLYDVQLKVSYHPQASKSGRVEVHRLIYEARMNNLEFTQFLDILLNEEEIAGQLKYIDATKYCVHHKDGCHYNNSVENLELMTKEEHLKHHSNTSYANFSQGMPVFIKVASITELQVEDVYDIECEEPHHNFVANGIIVHNSGKSNTSTAVANYIQLKTGHPIHLFFRLEPLIRFAQSTTSQVIIWDEPSLDSLSTDQLKEVNRNLLRLAMTIRKNRHFFIINLTKFWKFSEYIVVDRCLGMVHMYSKNEIEMGRFTYIKKKNLEKLWNDYTKGKVRNYRKLSSFRGRFPEIMTENFEKMNISVDNKDNSTYDDYEAAKSKSIHSIGKQKKKKDVNRARIWDLRKRIANIKEFPIKNISELSLKLGYRPSDMTKWKKTDPQIDETDEDIEDDQI